MREKRARDIDVETSLMRLHTLHAWVGRVSLVLLRLSNVLACFTDSAIRREEKRMRRRHARSEIFTRVISRVLCLASMVTMSPAVLGQAQEPLPPPTQSDNGTVTDVVTVTADPMRAIATGPSESAFGLSKSLLETPRSVL